MPLRRKIAVSLGAVAVLLGLAGCKDSLPGPAISSTPVATPIVVSNSPISSASPTPESADSEVSEARREATRTVIEQARERFPGRSAVAFIDVDSDSKLEFAEETQFESASLVKLIILAELYRQIQVGDHTFDERLTLLERQKVGGAGRLKDATEGTQFTLQTLAEAMITESDNTATQMLSDLLGRATIQEAAKKLGLSGTTFDRDIYDFHAIDAGHDNYITARDAGLFLQLLARQQLPGSEPMHEILERQKRQDMIGAGFPPSVRVAHKTGELNGILHDAAIVYAPRGTFVLVVLSDQIQDKEAAKKVWAQMALDILQQYQDSPPTPSATPSPSPPS